MNTAIRVLALGALLCCVTACTDDDPTTPESFPGHWESIEVLSHEFQDNRFFRLDLPAANGVARPDAPGRQPATEFIARASVRAYLAMPDAMPQAGDVQYVAGAVDSTGRWLEDDLADLPLDRWSRTWIARPIDLDFLLTEDGVLEAIDVGEELADDAVLFVTYDVVDDGGFFLYQVGDQPEELDPPGLLIEGVPYYRMKLLKPESRDGYTFQSVLRNVYELGIRELDLSTVSLSLEYAGAVQRPGDHDETGYTYLEVFGLDILDEQGQTGSDGQADWHHPPLFDPENGRIRFPVDVPAPFAAPEAFYRDNAEAAHAFDDDHVWQWDQTRLAVASAPELYDWMTIPANYGDYGRFKFILRYWQVDEGPDGR